MYRQEITRENQKEQTCRSDSYRLDILAEIIASGHAAAKDPCEFQKQVRHWSDQLAAIETKNLLGQFIHAKRNRHACGVQFDKMPLSLDEMKIEKNIFEQENWQMKRIRYFLGWIFVRPRRWLFWKMVANSNPRWLPCKKYWDSGIQWPNIHWWILYKTVFTFFRWLYYEAWRPLCKWKNGWRSTFPLPARIIHRVGSTTAGFAISGGECFHCASADGDQVELSIDETGTNFKLEKTWSVSTQDGTDHRFNGMTICPKCGYEDEYEDGSL